MTHIIPACDVRLLPNGDVAIDLHYLLDNIDIRKVIKYYKPSELLSLMEWKDIKAHLDEIKMSSDEP